MESSINFPLLNNVHNEVDNMEQKVIKGGWISAIYIIGESTVTAAKNINVWSGVATLLPLLGAFIADSYLGRFNTILISSLIYIMVGPRNVNALGIGGSIKISTSDQFDEDKPEEKKAKSSFFNWWYFGICGGSTAGMLIVFYVQDNVSWMVGFGIPALAMAFALVLFLFGWRSYLQEVPKGSPLVPVVQVFVAACRKRHLCVSKDGYEVCTEDGIGLASKGWTLARTHQFKCLDKAAIIDEMDALSETRNNWRPCSVSQVEEVKLLIRLVPIWLSCLTFAVIQAQGGTFFTKQGSSMDRLIGHNFRVPAASLQVIAGLVIIFTVPIYDRILVPVARNWTGHESGITMLQRIGAGMFFSILTMVVAALVEARRVKIATKYGLIDQPQITVPMSVWWLVPQYVLSGIQDVFAIVGLQEFFYDQMPDTMRSIGSATYLSVLGVGSLI
ncbi:Proton-dependent oligopeptide transporter family [Macleaya cordata]|uniref:Proton-dependent oligopeptide transporter family n=1 Tax=Macleaya cordata TaxID=56857 RepID=A0A200Q8C0_MACCD|nr:Proton-dependent oligopeptide transporter family [Macleaya cordata]